MKYNMKNFTIILGIVTALLSGQLMYPQTCLAGSAEKGSIVSLVTNRNPFTVTGVAKPGSTVTINNFKTTADINGRFSKPITLNIGKNLIIVTGIDGTEARTTQQRTVIYDNVPPNITVVSPTDKLETADNLLVVTGYTEPGSAVKVNGITAQVDDAGNFSEALDLSLCSNNITVVAEDSAGNKTTVNLAVHFKSNRIEDFKLPPQIRIGAQNSLQYTLGLDGYVTLSIYDDQGICVRNLLTESFNPAGAHSQNWEGKNDRGELVSDGSYRFVVEVKDAGGLPLGRAELTQLTAGFPSVGNFRVTPDFFNPGTGGRAEITFDLSCNAMVTAEVYRGNTLIKTIAANLWEPAGFVSLYWDGRVDNGSLAGDGSYSFRVKAFNPMEETFASTAKGQASIEKESPAIKDLSLRASKIIPGKSNLAVSYNLSEDALVTAKIVAARGGTVSTLLDRVRRKPGPGSLTWDGKSSAGKFVPKGAYKIVISAVDLTGKPSQEAAAAFTVEAQPPARTLPRLNFVTQQSCGLFADAPIRLMTPKITGLQKTLDPVNPLKNESTTISYSISNEALVSIAIVNGNTPVRTLLQKERQDAGQHSVVWNGRDQQGRPVGDGVYSCRIEALNPSPDSSTVCTARDTVTVEKEVPFITGVSLGQNTLKFGSSVNLRYTLSENCRVNLKIVDMEGNTARNILAGEPKKAGANSTSWDGKDNSGQYGAEGSYKFVINAVDNFGNSAEEQLFTFSAGYVPALQDVTAIPAPYNPNDENPGLLKMEYTVTHEALVTAEVMNGNSSVKKLLNAQRVNPGKNTLEWNGTDSKNVVVGDGTYYVRLKAASPTISVFQSVYKAVVTVEKENPRITQVTASPNPFKLTSAKQMSVRYTLSENARLSVGIYLGDTLIKSLISAEFKKAGNGSASWDGRDAENQVMQRGTYIIRMKAVDAFGNTGEVSQSVEFIPYFSVSSADPENEAADIAIDKKIEITFSETLQKNIDFRKILVQVQGRNVLYRGSLSGRTITLTPSSKLAYGTTYNVTISCDAAENKTGEHLRESYVFSFTTEGAPRPDTSLIDLSGFTTSSVVKAENKINTIITIDEEKALAAVAKSKPVQTALIPVIVNSDVISAALPAGLVKELAAKQALIQVRSPKAALIIPASVFKPDELAAQFGVHTSELWIKLVLTMPEPGQTANFQSQVKKQKLTAVSGPVQFRIEAAAKDKTSEITAFGSYVTFVLYLPNEVNASLLGGVAVNENTTLTPQPTKITNENGLAGAGISSRNTGTFAVVRGSVNFRDIKTHWARQDINLLAARLVVSGVNQNSFAPERFVTRSQFVTMVVKALGLQPKPQAFVFTDFSPNTWYNGYLAAGIEAGIVYGFSDKTFHPLATITREEAAAIILRAMQFVRVEDGVSLEAETVLARFKDAARISSWARPAVAGAVKTGVIRGYPNRNFAPRAKITRAESAAMIRSFLLKGGLI